jgi:hypothetical protein
LLSGLTYLGFEGAHILEIPNSLVLAHVVNSVHVEGLEMHEDLAYFSLGQSYYALVVKCKLHQATTFFSGIIM